MTHPEKYGRYQIKDIIGKGGMSTVYGAHDPRFGRDVALKVMATPPQESANFRRRFEREARTIAALEHPAIVPVYDYGEDHDHLYLVMRLMSGGSLADKIIMGTLTPDQIGPIVQRIGDALDHAHTRHVIHRDLKPGNILFDSSDRAYLSDFGIVKLAAEDSLTDLTGSGVIGTPAYMSPEQIHGDFELDGRSDIYTLGIILFEMLTGRKPYRAATPVKQMMAHVMEPVPNIREARPDLPPEFDTMMRKAMAKEPADRYPTASDLSNELTRTLTHFSLPAIPRRPEPDSDRTVLAGRVDPPTIPLADPPTPNALLGAVSAPQTAVSNRAFRRWLPWLIGGGIGLLGIVLSLTAIWFFFLRPDLTTVELSPTPASTTVVAVVEEPSPSPTAREIEGLEEGLIVETAVVPTPTDSPSPTPLPFTEMIEFGESANGEPLIVHRLGDGPRNIVFVGGIHSGWAPATVTLAESINSFLQADPSRVPEAVTLWIVPNANPDSREAPGELAGRLNGNEVDLNRNWDCNWRPDPISGGVRADGLGGTGPFSEPEVAALRTLIDTVEAEAVIFWQARVAGGLVSPGGCNNNSQVSVPLSTVYATGAGYPAASFEDLVNQSLNGDASNWLDSQGVPAISVLLPTFDTVDFDKNLAGVNAVLEWVVDGS